MKKSVLVICIFMIALAALAWFSQISTTVDIDKDYKESIKQAEEYVEKGLYQKAIASYDKALSLKDSKKTREAWLETGEMGYKDGVLNGSEYAKMIEKSCDSDPENVELRVILLSHYYDIGSYQKAYDAYKDCRKDGIKGKKIDELGVKIMYVFSVSGKAYNDYARSGEGYYSVLSGEEWGVIDHIGDRIIDCDYLYISPYNKEAQAVFVTEKDSRVIDKDGVVQHIIKEKIVESGAYGDGYLPVCTEDGKWKFLNCDSGKYEFGTYDAVSNFVNGVAAVCKDNKWTLIDTKNKTVSETQFDDIKLHSNGDYVYEGIMVASKKGKYGIYDAKGKAVCDFTSSDMDAYYGGDIAYCTKDGMWGYVTVKGKTVIKPQYENAKSFSSGLAAVSKDGKWGFVDSSNTMVIENQFLEADYISSKGVCFVSSYENAYQLLKLKFFEK